METLPRQPAEEKQGRPTMLLRKRKRLEENDKKSGKSRSRENDFVRLMLVGIFVD